MPGLIERLNALEADVKTLDADTGTKAINSGNKNAEKIGGAPHVRKGEDPMSSRGYRLTNLIGVLNRTVSEENAKLEVDLAEKFHKHFTQAGHYVHAVPGSALVPFGMDYLPESHNKDLNYSNIKAMVIGGAAGADPDEIGWIARKAYGQKAQSWLNDNLGGTVVAPPAQGELIELFRNKDVLINAGATMVPLPAQGRIVFPRQTAACTGYWVGENQPITDSQVKTGSLILSGKKVGAICKLPNELLRFGGAAAEAMVRMDMIKTLALTADKQLLDGQGSDTRPNGLLNTPGLATVTPTTVGNNGNTLAPGDVYKFLAAVAANNANFEGWVYRPELFYAMAAKRSDTSAGAGTGPFLFDITRSMGQGLPNTLVGYPVTMSPQVSNTRTKGNASNLTYAIGGQWSDFLFGTWGTLELGVFNQGDTMVTNDQTWVRAIMTVDGGARHPGAFAAADQLTQTV